MMVEAELNVTYTIVTLTDTEADLNVVNSSFKELQWNTWVGLRTANKPWELVMSTILRYVSIGRLCICARLDIADDENVELLSETSFMDRYI